MGKKYPAEVHEFILANYKGIPSGELARMTNERFGTEFTSKSILSYKKNYHLASGAKNGMLKNTWSPTYPLGIYEFIRDKCAGMNREDTAAAVNEYFGTGTMTAQRAAEYRKNHKLPCGNDTRFKKGDKPKNQLAKGEYFPGCEVSWFKKGHVPKNHNGIGTKKKRTDGYQFTKVQEQGKQWERWKPTAKIVWEENFGEIKPGMMVGFKDGNIDNLDPKNLFLMTKEENLEMNRHGKRSSVPEVTETRLNIAKVKIAAKNARKRGSNHGKQYS